MQRVSILFATATILLLILGLVAMYLASAFGLAVTSKQTMYQVPLQTICFGAALVFCCFAFFYSLWMVPWSARAASWHFVLSMILLVAWGLGLMTFMRVAQPGHPSGGTLPLPTQVILGSWILVPFLFAGLQAWFLVDGLRRWVLFARG